MKYIALSIVRFFSLVFRTMGIRACRFYPTCSVYSCDAFRHFGFFRAFRLMTKRILRCHPFSAGGFDPLPSKAAANEGLA